LRDLVFGGESFTKMLYRNIKKYLNILIIFKKKLKYKRGQIPFDGLSRQRDGVVKRLYYLINIESILTNF